MSPPKKRWAARVTTESTHPPEGLFTKDAATIARALASKKVSPKGPGSGMRMLTFFIYRGCRGLTATRLRELEKAKKLLLQRIHKEKKSKADCASIVLHPVSSAVEPCSVGRVRTPAPTWPILPAGQECPAHTGLAATTRTSAAHALIATAVSDHD